MGKEIFIRNFRGDFLLIDFMFIECLPCHRKLPLIDIVQNAVEDKMDNIIIIDGSKSTFNAFKKFITNNDKTYDRLNFYYDSKGLFTTENKIQGYPTEFIINKEGKIILKSYGFDPNTKDEYCNERIRRITKNLF